jgi:hypothetical protein
MTFLRRFGAFWYDFLVGDRWELFLGPIAVLAIAWVLETAGASGLVAGAAIVIGITLVGAISVANAAR